MTIGKPLVCNLSIVQIVENGSVNFLEATKTILGNRVGRNVWMHIHRPPRMTTRCRIATRVRGERGGTTGVLDRRVGEKEREDARVCRDKKAHGNAARQRRRQGIRPQI